MTRRDVTGSTARGRDADNHGRVAAEPAGDHQQPGGGGLHSRPLLHPAHARQKRPQHRRKVGPVLRPRETWALQAATQRKHNYIHVVVTFTTLACVLQATHSVASGMDRECEEDTETAVRIPKRTSALSGGRMGKCVSSSLRLHVDVR